MLTHTLSSETFAGQIAGRRSVLGDEVLCVIDIAPRTLGLRSAAMPTTLLRGTVTYTMTGAGQCMAFEHTVRAANGEKVDASLLCALTDAMVPLAQECLHEQGSAVDMSDTLPRNDVDTHADVIPMHRELKRAQA